MHIYNQAADNLKYTYTIHGLVPPTRGDIYKNMNISILKEF